MAASRPPVWGAFGLRLARPVWSGQGGLDWAWPGPAWLGLVWPRLALVEESRVEESLVEESRDSRRRGCSHFLTRHYLYA